MCSLESHAKLHPLEMYGQIHSDLVTLTNKIVQFFSPCIILAILAHLVLMASDFYIICIILSTRESWKSKDGLSLVLMCFWFTFHAMETVILLSVSDSTANEVLIVALRCNDKLFTSSFFFVLLVKFRLLLFFFSNRQIELE